MLFLIIQNEDPELRKQLADFIIYFSTVESFITDFAYHAELFEGKKPIFKEIAKRDLSIKRNIIKEFIQNKIPELFDNWNKINNRIGNINSERKYLVHSIGLFNISSTHFHSRIRVNGKFKIYTASDIHKLNNLLDEVLFGKEGLSTSFYSRYIDEIEKLKKACT
jgi:hypothetical protein